uniref:T9SS type A sorting domain-containing protein n=1 Tax=candidate division WOR-3 bacterium TaxID=2052148 RepID=A0A7C6ENV5_UNCW3
MNRIAFLFLILSVLMFANPLLTGVINEFQTDIILGQKIEFHPINYGWEIPLVNTKVYAPGCSAFIDTSISNPPYGYTVIDSTILNGNIFLPLQTGYIYLYKSDYFIDEINYSDTLHSPILAPPPGASASRFAFIYFYNNQPYPSADWYIDSTPTLGTQNDDYPGCVISGYVYLNNNPIPNAIITANIVDSIQTSGPFHKACTTYTNNDGFYKFDSLWPVRYWMTATFGNYPPYSELSPRLWALWQTNLNFYFVGGEESKFEILSLQEPLNIYPNPFRNRTIIRYTIHDTGYKIQDTRYMIQDTRYKIQDIRLKIYDISGRLVKSFNLESCIMNHESAILWDGDDDSGRRLPSGVYFVRLETDEFKKNEKVILLR